MFNKVLLLLTFIVNLPIYYFSYLIPKRNNIWVFGARQGSAFAENAKHLFLYVQKNHPEIKCIWLSRSKQVIKDLKSEGYKSFKTHSFLGYYYTILAKVVFVTSLKFVPSDLNFYVWNEKTIKIQLWHGSPIKKIIYDNPNANFSKNKLFDRILRFFFPFYKYLSLVKFNKAIAASQQVQKILMSAFNMKKEDILITGYPKNDYVLNNAKNFELKEKQVKKIVFMPTWREGSFDIFSDKYKWDILKLDLFCKNNNIVLDIKLHPYSYNQIKGLRKNLKNCLNINLLEIADIYDVIHEYDILITDYSSIIFDYLLLEKPIIFTQFDLEYYSKEEAGFYYDLKQITPGIVAKDWIEVEKSIQTYNADSQLHGDLRKKISDKFNTYKDNKSSERVFHAIISLIK